MTAITFKGTPVNTLGILPKTGSKTPDFTLTANDLKETSLQEFTGKRIIFNIFPSLDTGTCANSVRQFNQAAGKLTNTVVLCVSMDLPFAQKRFCGAENLTNVITLSAFRHPEFGKNYGVTIVDGPLTGLLSRAIVTTDENGKILYTEQVAEITEEPNYTEALASLDKTATS